MLPTLWLSKCHHCTSLLNVSKCPSLHAVSSIMDYQFLISTSEPTVSTNSALQQRHIQLFVHSQFCKQEKGPVVRSDGDKKQGETEPGVICKVITPPAPVPLVLPRTKLAKKLTTKKPLLLICSINFLTLCTSADKG